jgi:ABC-type transport system involved in multi-copper enzyme maturation permease subunit
VLFYKAWLETRWRFVIPLLVAAAMACALVFGFPSLSKAVADMPKMEGRFGALMMQAVERLRDYRSFVWSQWFDKNLGQIFTITALLLGAGGLMAETQGGAALYTLSLPARRRRLLGARVAVGMSELAALAVLPSLLLPLLSPLIGRGYSLADTLVHASCLAVCGSVFYALSVLLSVFFADVLRPVLIGGAIALLLGVLVSLAASLRPYSVFRLMGADEYFLSGQVPWLGLLACAAASAAMLWAAAYAVARRDF